MTAPDSVTYNVVELVGDSLTVQVDVGGAWWEYRFERVATVELSGNWKLDFAGVGPSQEDASSFFSISDTGPDGPRAVGLTISTNSVPTVRLGMSRATRPGSKAGRAAVMPVGLRLRLTMAAITPSSGTTRKRQRCS